MWRRPKCPGAWPGCRRGCPDRSSRAPRSWAPARNSPTITLLWADRATGRLWTTNCLGLEGAHGPVVAFRLAADGDATPATSIGGTATGLSGCQTGVTVDGLGNIVVADTTNTNRDPGGHIAIFKSGRHGNVAPARRIGGAAANFHSPSRRRGRRERESLRRRFVPGLSVRRRRASLRSRFERQRRLDSKNRRAVQPVSRGRKASRSTPPGIFTSRT